VTSTQHPSVRYDDRALRYGDECQDETFPKLPVNQNMARMLVDLVGERPRVIDAGCGAGQAPKMLRNRGCDEVGVVAAEKLIELARTADPGLAFTVGDLRALPDLDKDLDALVAGYFVIHIAPDEVPTVLPSSRVSCAAGSACSLSSHRRVPHRPTPSPTLPRPRGRGTADEFAALASRAGLVERDGSSTPGSPT
jgi:SAM-dependent methyltransferase